MGKEVITKSTFTIRIASDLRIKLKKYTMQEYKNVNAKVVELIGDFVSGCEKEELTKKIVSEKIERDYKDFQTWKKRKKLE